jgi:nucleoside-diphosphate-sugar epimerase
LKILILGANGFIGHHLCRSILARTSWQVYAMDMQFDRLAGLDDQDRLTCYDGDITINHEWLEYHIKKCDIVIPLVAIATPAVYVRDPLSVFELDFEANLPIIRACAKYHKRVIFPSTSEVYGMCKDEEFHPYESNLVLGPLTKSRWMYACAKQLMDRVIVGYGQQHDLDYTLFRPFNWIGCGLDNMHKALEGSSRVVTQFLGNIARGEDIKLVDGGRQRRSFTDVSDGINALMKIIANEGGRASGKIYNIGNPRNDLSIRELANLMLEIAAGIPEYRCNLGSVGLVEMASDEYYGKGYQDILTRVPFIENTCCDLDWAPRVGIRTSLTGIFEHYRREVGSAADLLDGDAAA